MLDKPYFDPEKSYEENWEQGPFNGFADGEIVETCPTPGVDLFGKKICTPIGIPAGPLLNGAFVKAALDKGFDVPMHKTVRTRVKQSHPWPNVLAVQVEGDLTLEKASGTLVGTKNYTEPLSITNSFANPSYDPEIWQKELKECVAHAKEGQMVTASWEGTDWDDEGFDALVKDWQLGGKLLKETGIGMMEMNFSCPNKGTAALLCHDLESSQKIADAVKNEIGDFPLAVKMSFMDQEYLEQFVKALGDIVDAFSAINTIASDVVDENGDQALPGKGRLRSGVCGHAIKWANIDMTKRLHELRASSEHNFVIISSGGVVKPEDYFEVKDAGADVVMSATGSMWDPYLAKKVTLQQAQGKKKTNA